MPVSNSDRITIGLYSLQTEEGFDPSFLKEIPNIITIKKNFDRAAALAGRAPPGVVISLFLIPAWAKKSDFNNATYKKIEKAMVDTLVKKLIEAHFPDIKIELFYVKTEKEEKAYLEHLTSKGSCADMIKTHALIDKDNETRRHLQLDSNTQIHDFVDLYNSTFGALIQKDCIALNASYYDIDYVSAHNKIVYTVPHSDFITKLRKVHLDYCKNHANDHLVNREEKSKKNSIYARDFVVALEEIGLTRSVEFMGGSYVKPRKIYPAVLEKKDAYRLTKYVVTAVNRTWASELPNLFIRLKELPLVKIGDTLCDYASFVGIVKKYVKALSMHKYGGHPEAWLEDCRTRNQENIREDASARTLLLQLSDSMVDKVIITRFYDSTVNHITKTVGDPDEKDSLMELITQNFNLQPIRGNILVQELFGYTLDELFENPFISSKQFKLESFRNYMHLEINRAEKYRDYLNAMLEKSQIHSKHHYLTLEHEKAESIVKNQQNLFLQHEYDYLTDTKLINRYEKYVEKAEGIKPCSDKLITQREKIKLGKEIKKRGLNLPQTNLGLFGEESSNRNTENNWENGINKNRF